MLGRNRMQRAQRQLPLFPADGTLQVPLPRGVLDNADELLTELLIAVFETRRVCNPRDEGDSHGKDHSSSPSA
jgi:hypothetical protein